MNPLTQIKNTQKITKAEIAAGYSDSQSWHARFKHSAYIFTGGLPYGLTEGDLLAVFSQYGEIIDVNLVRHKDTGKSRGFAFLAYEDQRSTNLAVDNLNGAKVGGRTVTVDHVDNYKRKRAEVDGREESDSEEEEAALHGEEAEAAAIQAAIGEGAQVVSEHEARVASNGAAGPRHGSGGGDEPWAAKTSVFAILNSEMPEQKGAPASHEEDPLLNMQKDKKQKKEKKHKKDKKEKKDKARYAHEYGSIAAEESTPPQGDHTRRTHLSRYEQRSRGSIPEEHIGHRKDERTGRRDGQDRLHRDRSPRRDREQSPRRNSHRGEDRRPSEHRRY